MRRFLPYSFVIPACCLGMGTVALAGCTSDDGSAATSAPSTSPTSATSTMATASATAESPTDSTEAAESSDTFPAQGESAVTVDASRFSAQQIYPMQPGLMFTTARGDYCEMFPAGDHSPQPTTLCSLRDGGADANALKLTPEAASVTLVNRPMAAAQGTQVLNPRERLVFEGMSCSVTTEDEVLCETGDHRIRIGDGDYEAY